MQQNSATLMYDLNTTKGTVESHLKKISQPFKTVQFQAWKIAPSSKSLKKKKKEKKRKETEKKQKTVLSHLKPFRP